MTQVRLDKTQTATVYNNGSRGMAVKGMLTLQYYIITLSTVNRAIVGRTATALSLKRCV